MSDLQRNLMKARLPPMAPRTAKNSQSGRQKDYTPTEWKNYFEDFVDVKVSGDDPETSFRVYRSAPAETPNAPVLVLLHGGGFNGLTWSVFTTEITSIIHCQCLAIDFRGHGNTKTADDDDLSAETMAHDIANVLEKLYEDVKLKPGFLIMGHSMGGAIAIHIASMHLVRSLLGIVVIDVVEGTALESLQSMQSFLRSRPTHFKSIINAIEWCVRSGQIRNVESARVSMPGQIVNCDTKLLATSELPLKCFTPESAGLVDPNSIPEDAEVEAPAENKFMVPADVKPEKYTWRIDLSRSEQFWNGWFEGLSDKFLDITVPRLLILAGIDNLDKKLTVGQMQGKFQLAVLARTGHAVHEDQPHQVAETLASYLIRNKFAEAKADFEYRMPQC